MATTSRRDPDRPQPMPIRPSPMQGETQGNYHRGGRPSLVHWIAVRWRAWRQAKRA